MLHPRSSAYSDCVLPDVAALDPYAEVVLPPTACCPPDQSKIPTQEKATVDRTIPYTDDEMEDKIAAAIEDFESNHRFMSVRRRSPYNRTSKRVLSPVKISCRGRRRGRRSRNRDRKSDHRWRTISGSRTGTLSQSRASVTRARSPSGKPVLRRADEKAAKKLTKTATKPSAGLLQNREEGPSKGGKKSVKKTGNKKLRKAAKAK